MPNISPNREAALSVLARYTFAHPSDLQVAKDELEAALRLSMTHTNAYTIPLDQQLPAEVDRDAAAPYVHPYNIAAALLSVWAALQPHGAPAIAADLLVYDGTGWTAAATLTCSLLPIALVPPPPPVPPAPPPPTTDLVSLVDAALAETAPPLAPAPITAAGTAAAALAAPQSVPANPVPPVAQLPASSAHITRPTPLPPGNVWPNPATGRIDTPLRYAQYQHDQGLPIGEGFGVGPDGIVYAIPAQPALPPENDYRAAGSISTEAQFAQYRVDTGHAPPPGYANQDGVAVPVGAAAAPAQDPYLQVTNRIPAPPSVPERAVAHAPALGLPYGQPETPQPHVGAGTGLPDPSVLAERTGESGKPQKSPFERKVEPRTKVADAPFWWKSMRYSMPRILTTNPAAALDPSSTGSGPVQSYAVLLAILQDSLRGVDGEVTVAELRQWMREVDTGIAALPSASAINQLVDHLFA
jgi:hypothetical protein